MKKLPCKAYGCAERRIHWCEPDTPRGTQFVEVPEDWPDDRPVFCSLTCAMLGGYMKANITNPCPKCLVQDIYVEHGFGYTCWQPEVTQEQVDTAIAIRKKRMDEFKAKYGIS
jgi:hypothetical protein